MKQSRGVTISVVMHYQVPAVCTRILGLYSIYGWTPIVLEKPKSAVVEHLTRFCVTALLANILKRQGTQVQSFKGEKAGEYSGTCLKLLRKSWA